MKNKFIFLFLLFLFTCNIFPTIRYVSKTGSSTPPYLTWETASDSIQKCINVCSDGDTVIVGNGVYKECLKINKILNLLGTSMDSTIIDARGLVITGQDSLYTINIYKKTTIKNFHIYGHAYSAIVSEALQGIDIEDCFIENAYDGIGILSGTLNIIQNCIIKVYDKGILNLGNTSDFLISSNLIIISGNDPVGYQQQDNGSVQLISNIILSTHTNPSSRPGISISYLGRTEIRNNLVAGFSYVQYRGGSVFDSVFIINNIFGYCKRQYGALIEIGNPIKHVLRNNIMMNAKAGIETLLNGYIYPDYNLYWKLDHLYDGHIIPGEHELSADPMFVKDTVPTPNLSFNFHLQKYSPGIDAGDPDILDVDGSRSDMGMFGGPLGQKYTYLDLAPRPPKNLSGVYADKSITLKWNRNTEADLSHYVIYRDTVPDFMYDSLKRIGTTSDTLFCDNVNNLNKNPQYYYYKVTAWDSAGNQSTPSNEINVQLTGMAEIPPKVIQPFQLMNNYPNPFNPTTTIPYVLKEPGYVKVIIYDILGEIVRVLVNGYQQAGYYEAEFTPTDKERPKGKSGFEFWTGYGNNIASGIYLYRIEVINDNRIPVFMDMKKMILLK